MWYRPCSSWLRRGGPRPAGATRNESSALLCVTGTVTALSGDTRPPVERVTRPPDAGKSDGTAPSVGIPKVGTSDGELVRRVLAGDTGAYAALVARYRDRLGRYAVHMLGDRQDAEEALQDAFVRAHRSLARCDDPERFGAWLYGILVNRCRTTGGRAARRARLFVRDDAALSGVPLPSPAERAEWDDTVRWALGRLTPEYREAFLLKHVEDLEYEEMAQLTGSRPSFGHCPAGEHAQRQRKPRPGSFSSSWSRRARPAWRSSAISTIGTPRAPRCDRPRAAVPSGPRCCRCRPGAIATPSSSTAPAGSPIPRRRTRATTSSARRARSSPWVARDAAIPCGRGRAGRAARRDRGGAAAAVLALAASARDADLIDLRRAVERDIALGAAPTAATAAAMAGVFGADALHVNAGARDARPGRP